MPIAIERLLGRAGTVLQAQGYALAVILAAATIAIVLAVDATGDIAGQVVGRRGRRGHQVDGACSRSVTSRVTFDGTTVLDARVDLGRRRVRSSPCSARPGAARARCCA